jgi:DNA repair exonuclease SbcCD ATPase subunit
MTVIRGVRTEIELDAGGERIERVLTYRDDGVEPLPFSSLSGGAKEQVALLVRVILARLIAAQNPERREILILDDPLTQTDEARRPALYRVLRQASEHPRILFVTSHSDTAGLAPEQVIVF